MIHYKIRSTKESIVKIFEREINNVCFCIDSNNQAKSGVCDIVVIPGNDEIVKILKDHFILSKIEYDELEYNEVTPPYFNFDTLGNTKLL